MKEELNNLKNNALAQVFEANNLETLEELRITYLGRNGKINDLTKEIKNLGNEEKRGFGILLNESKKTIEEAINARIANIKNIKSKEWFDYSIPGKNIILDTFI